MATWKCGVAGCTEHGETRTRAAARAELDRHYISEHVKEGE